MPSCPVKRRLTASTLPLKITSESNRPVLLPVLLPMLLSTDVFFFSREMTAGAVLVSFCSASVSLVALMLELTGASGASGASGAATGLWGSRTGGLGGVVGGVGGGGGNGGGGGGGSGSSSKLPVIVICSLVMPVKV